MTGRVATLGPLVAAWIESHCAIPDGPCAGQPYKLTTEMAEFVQRYYSLDSTGRWLYERGGQYVRSQKAGKSPFAAAIALAEAAGPTRFAGWANGGERTDWGYTYAAGDPIGATVPTAHIQIAASSIDQAQNCWRCIGPMIQLGPLDDRIPDVGETRINLPDGGLMQPVTAAAISRLGARLTFAVFEETHAWTKSNRGRELADTMRRNLAGMHSRFFECTNSWDPAEESVAQITAEGAEGGVLLDDREPGAGSIRNATDRRRMLREAYGDAAAGCRASDGSKIEPWVDVYRIEAEFLALLDRDAPQAERYFLNRKVASESAAFDPAMIDARATDYRPAPGAVIVASADGARSRDAIAIVACEVATGFVWAPLILERPEGAPEDYEHPLDQVDGAMIDLFETYEVRRVLVDPYGIELYLERWQARWGDKVVFPWQMNRPRAVAYAVKRLAEAVSAGDLSHDGDPLFVAHLKNAQRRKVNVVDDQGRQLWTVGKDRFDSPRKIDAAAATILAWEARGDVAAGGIATEPRELRGGWFDGTYIGPESPAEVAEILREQAEAAKSPRRLHTAGTDKSAAWL